MRVHLTVILVSTLLVPACGGGRGAQPVGSPSPTSPTPPSPPQNRPPTVTSVSVNPTFGIADLQVFNFTVVATDPDGDALTYSWNIAGNAASGPTPQIMFGSPGGAGTATVTVSDSRGGTATASVDFTVGSMSGAWSANGPGVLAVFQLQLTQSANGIIRGTFTHPTLPRGELDPAQPGLIQTNGSVLMRVKVPPFTDFTMNGTMDSTGRRVVGTITGSGFTGQPFVMTK